MRVGRNPSLKNKSVKKSGITTPIGEKPTKCLKKLIPARIAGRIRKI